MSCYNNRDRYNYIASKTSSGAKFLSFTDAISTPETVAILIRNLLSDAVGIVKRRAFQMYILLTSLSTSKADVTKELPKDYELAVEAIFSPFINAYGKYNNSINYSRDLTTARILVVNYMKRITGCGDVNIIFKSKSATP